MAVMQAPPVQAQPSMDRAWTLYYQVRSQIETPDNIGKLILFDLDSDDYEIAEDQLGFAASALVRSRHPSADIFCLRIGYDCTLSLGGSMERLST